MSAAQNTADGRPLANDIFIEGPWIPNLGTLFVRKPDGRAIASVYGDSDLLSDECGRARTRLIAAAPDLLKVLEALERAAQAHLDCTDGSEREYLREEMANARAALTAAKGGA